MYSIIGTWLTYKVGNKLVGLNFVQQKYEADFRFAMMRMRENAESVAFYSGEGHEGGVFKKRFSLLLNNFWSIIKKQKQLTWLNSWYSQIAIIFPWSIIKKQKQLTWLNSWYSQIAIIFPLVVAMPRYLAKEITLGGLMQISSAFGRVQESLSYFVEMYSSIAEWQAVVERLTGFGLHMQQVKQENAQQNLQRKPGASDAIVATDMDVTLPDESAVLQNVSFTLEPGTNVLIKGVSGSGKSTLLRALAGIWPYVKGTLEIPEESKLMFIPQRPYLPLGTLKESLLYPGTESRTDEELKQLMEDCCIGYLYEKLYLEADWSHVLSVGEQQRLAFVRALIYKPVWLFLDEASSALDEETEAKVYTLLMEEAQQTTLVSVGHRSTLNKYHQKVLYLDKETHSLYWQEKTFL